MHCGRVNVLRFLDANCVRLEMETAPTEPPPDESDAARARRERDDKERALEEFAHLLEPSGAVVNANKLTRDLINRERKATTAVLPGIAVPHVRTLQVRRFVMGFTRAAGDGLPFASLDGAPSKLFFILVSPPYDDRTYLQVYRELAQVAQDEDIVQKLIEAREVQDVFNALRAVFR
jgi:PTS system fructose-specific IIC component